MAVAAMMCLATLGANAQDPQDSQEARNQTYSVTLGDVQYAHHNEKMSAGEAVGKVLTGVLAGHEAKTQIGKLKIEAVEGEDISLCKVQNGGKDIKTAIEAGAQLRVMTIDK